SQAEIKNAITQMQTQMEAIKRKIDEAEDQISVTEDKIMENNEAEKKRETKVRDHQGRLREFTNLLKCDNIHIIGVTKDEKRKKGAEGLGKEIIDENLPNLGKDTDIKIQEAQRTTITFNKKRPSS
ncbi:LORF1 protein, partial [Crocuta crocuta]